MGTSVWDAPRTRPARPPAAALPKRSPRGPRGTRDGLRFSNLERNLTKRRVRERRRREDERDVLTAAAAACVGEAIGQSNVLPVKR